MHATPPDMRIASLVRSTLLLDTYSIKSPSTQSIATADWSGGFRRYAAESDGVLSGSEVGNGLGSDKLAAMRYQ